MADPWAPPNPPGGAKFTPSRALVKATYQLLMADKSMIVLLFGGGVAAAAVLGGIMFPAWFYGHITPNIVGSGWVGIVVYAAAIWAATFVMVLVTGAVVAAAMIRADGGTPTVRAAIGVAWSRRWQLAAWATVSTLVGVLMNLLQRFGIGGLAVRLVAGIGWAVATIFAIPLVISEGTMPAATLRRSAAMVKGTFGATIRSNIRLAAPWVIAMVVSLIVAVAGVVAIAVGVSGHLTGTALLGGAIAVVGGVSFFFTCVTSAALSAYLHTMLFRYATGQPIPGIDPADLPPLRATS
ncbi:MAG TPA: DUF6159 family protein [Streptosporangiaceae bacterium]|nr:DUF6159 family protein [Streptosporangiaceae bacterium]